MSHYKRNAVIGSAVAIVVGLSIGIGILYIPHQTTARTPFPTSTSLCGSNSSIATVNETTFCSDDVSNDIVVQNPGGYAYFLNGSIIFMGVNFTSICPQGYYGCPGMSGTKQVTTMSVGVVRLDLTFPDQTTETIGGIIGINYFLTLLSTHANPRAGIMLLDTHSGYQVFLLVQAPIAYTTTCLQATDGSAICATTTNSSQ